MRILFINSVCGIGSTGRICTDTAVDLEAQGHEVKIAYGRGVVPAQHTKYAVRIGHDLDVYLSGLHSRLTDRHGFANKRATKKFLEWAEQYNPDLLWLHNLHGYYINIEMLFEWIKSRPGMQVKWTLHDCWAFTGHCSHFSAVKCDKWKTKCEMCVQKKEYPSSLLKDNSMQNYLRKKSSFTGVADMTVITPSYWLASLVKQSFLQEYPVDVIYNSIDRNIFKPTDSDFKEQYNLQNKMIVLGVASVWGERKGLNDFIELSKLLDDRYVIVLVGLTEKQMKKMPHNVIGIPRTYNLQELAAIYSAADVFINPSKEESFGLTTVEAIACGTPVVVYKNTACEEIVSLYGGGKIVDQKILMMLDAISKVTS